LLIGFWFTEGFGGVGGEEGVHRKSHWRLRIFDRTVFDDQTFWIVEFRSSV